VDEPVRVQMVGEDFSFSLIQDELRKPDAVSVVFDRNPDAKVDVHRALPFSSWDWLCGQSGP
jgi:hypothetical protein